MPLIVKEGLVLVAAIPAGIIIGVMLMYVFPARHDVGATYQPLFVLPVGLAIAGVAALLLNFYLL